MKSSRRWRAPLAVIAPLAIAAACGSTPHPDPKAAGGTPLTSPPAASGNVAPGVAPSASSSAGVAAESGSPPAIEHTSNTPFRGANPFEAPPSGPAPKLEPPPPRPPGSDPPPERRAHWEEQCGKIKDCGACNNAGFCGFCEATKRCVPKDAHGPLTGTCSAGYSPKECRMALYIEAEEPKLRARLAEMMGDLSPDGMPIDTKVGGASSIRIAVKRGHCYGLVYRGSYDVEGDLNANAAAEARFIGSGGRWAPIYNEVAALTPFCPQEDGAIVVAVAPNAKAKGTWRAQLFSAPIAESTLRAQMEQHETEQRMAVVRYHCGFCARVYVGCFLSGEPRCEATYLGCLGQVGLTPLDCERGDVPRPPPPKPPQEANRELPSPLASMSADDDRCAIAEP